MFLKICEILSLWMIPMLILLIILVGFIRKVKVYEAFTEGAAEGFYTSVKIMPFLIAMMVAITIFRTSGALDNCIFFLQPFLQYACIPPELVTLAIMRPLSGTGALGIVTDTINTFGPDSLIGKMAATILGSTDTTFYILAVYFGAVGITKPRYALFVGLIGDMIGFWGSIYVCRILFFE